MPPIFLLFCFVQAKRIYATHSVVAFTGSSGHLRFSKLPSDFRRLRGLLASMRFNGRRFARNGRNAYLRRNTLSGLRFCPLFCLPMVGGASATLPPPFMVRGGCANPPLLASPFGKGRCHEVTEGIRKPVSEKTRDVKSLLLPSLCKRGALGSTLSRPFSFQKGKREGLFSEKLF